MTAAKVGLRVTAAGNDTQPMVVAVTGEVDVTNADEFAQSVRALVGPQRAVLDLSELAYLGSAGYAALDGLLATGAIRLVLGPQSRLRRAATLMHLPYSDSVDAALKAT